MDGGIATFVAALVAAISGVITLVVTTIVSWSAVQRSAHRDLLTPYMSALSKELHQIIACSDMISKCGSAESVRSWHERAAKSQTKLKDIRTELRYPLWGIDIGLRTLTRLPNWVENARKCPDVAKKLLVHGDKLGTLVDLAILDCYRKGLPPGFIARWRVRMRAQKLREEFKKFGKQRKAVLLSTRNKPMHATSARLQR